MFKGKTVKVIITGKAKEEFYNLSKTVKEEIKKEIEKSEHQVLLNSIKQKVEMIKQDPEYGIHIQKNKIPKQYIEKYGVNNLWKVNLSKYWRMIYTLKGNASEIIVLILDIIDHKKYNKIFGYKKR